MALPKIVQKLFSDEGKGSKLNSEIIPPLKDKTSEELFTFIGEKGELTYNTTEKRIVAHDGVTKGGIPMAKKAEVDAIDVGVTSFNGSKGAVTYSAPVSSVNGQTGAVTVDVGVTSVNGNTGDITPEQTGCLPLSGGTMTGVIEFDRETGHIYKKDANGRMVIRGGTGSSTNGASLYLNAMGYANNPGSFTLKARDSTNEKDLKGLPDGTLTWGGKRVISGGDVFISASVSATLPSGGTWAVIGHSSGAEKDGGYCATVAGGTTISMPDYKGKKFIFAIRIS